VQRLTDVIPAPNHELQRKLLPLTHFLYLQNSITSQLTLSDTNFLCYFIVGHDVGTICEPWLLR